MSHPLWGFLSAGGQQPGFSPPRHPLGRASVRFLPFSHTLRYSPQLPPQHPPLSYLRTRLHPASYPSSALSQRGFPPSVSPARTSPPPPALPLSQHSSPSTSPRPPVNSTRPPWHSFSNGVRQVAPALPPWTLSQRPLSTLRTAPTPHDLVPRALFWRLSRLPPRQHGTPPACPVHAGWPSPPSPAWLLHPSAPGSPSTTSFLLTSCVPSSPGSMASCSCPSSFSCASASPSRSHPRPSGPTASDCVLPSAIVSPAGVRPPPLSPSGLPSLTVTSHRSRPQSPPSCPRSRLHLARPAPRRRRHPRPARHITRTAQPLGALGQLPICPSLLRLAVPLHFSSLPLPTLLPNLRRAFRLPR